MLVSNPSRPGKDETTQSQYQSPGLDNTAQGQGSSPTQVTPCARATFGSNTSDVSIVQQTPPAPSSLRAQIMLFKVRVQPKSPRQRWDYTRATFESNPRDPCTYSSTDPLQHWVLTLLDLGSEWECNGWLVSKDVKEGIFSLARKPTACWVDGFGHYWCCLRMPGCTLWDTCWQNGPSLHTKK